MFGWCCSIEYFRIVAVDGDGAILCGNDEWESIFAEVALGGYELKLWVKDVVAPFLEGVDDAADEDVEEDDVSLGFADEEDVGVVGMCIHGSNSPVLLADVSAEFAGDSAFS